MINSRKQTGSALVIVIIILLVAVIGVLGYVLWSNYLAPKDSQSKTTSGEDKDESYANWSTYRSERDSYSIKYPSNWNATSETENDGPYIRNFQLGAGGYPEGYINVRVLLNKDDANFKAMSGLSTAEWYERLGTVEVQKAAVSYSPEDVKQVSVSGFSAKSAKAVFTETNEEIYLLKDSDLYSIHVYPYGGSADATVKLMLDSFEFI